MNAESLNAESHQPLPTHRVGSGLKRIVKTMIGPLEKGLKATRIETPPSGVYEGVDLRSLPKYLCFRAALLRSQLTYQYGCLILAGLLVVTYTVNRIENSDLQARLRKKEYILAPGVQNFQAAKPEEVTIEYVHDAIDHYLNLLGTFSPGTIEKQYKALENAMSPQLRVHFAAKSERLKAQVKADEISQISTLTEKEILSQDGFYKVTALVRKETYINNEYTGHTDDVVEMVLQLVPPKSELRWFLQINSLNQESSETFKRKKDR